MFWGGWRWFVCVCCGLGHYFFGIFSKKKFSGVMVRRKSFHSLSPDVLLFVCLVSFVSQKPLFRFFQLFNIFFSFFLYILYLKKLFILIYYLVCFCFLIIFCTHTLMESWPYCNVFKPYGERGEMKKREKKLKS